MQGFYVLRDMNNLVRKNISFLFYVEISSLNLSIITFKNVFQISSLYFLNILKKVVLSYSDIQNIGLNACIFVTYIAKNLSLIFFFYYLKIVIILGQQGYAYPSNKWDQIHEEKILRNRNITKSLHGNNLQIWWTQKRKGRIDIFQRSRTSS